MKISASLFSVHEDYHEYAMKLKYSKVDMLHIDYLDGVEAPIPIIELENFNKQVDMPLDVHLVVADFTETDIYYLNKAKVKYLSVQYENLDNKDNLSLLESFHGKWGLAITMDTPLDVLESYINVTNYVLIMCSKPGISGAKFDDRNIDRIETISKLWPDCPIHVDGGIKNINAGIMKQLGVKIIISGSYLAGGNKIFENVFNLHYENGNGLNAKQIMQPLSHLPIADENAHIIDIIETISKYRLGVVFITDSSDNLLGIISDGDIRKALIQYQQDIFSKRSRDIMNANPYNVTWDDKLSHIMKGLFELNKGINVIPVIRESNQLIGAIDFNRGI